MRKPKPLPSVEYLSERFDYDPNTGKVTNKIRMGARGLKGAESGTVRNTDGYRSIKIDGVTTLTHRIAWKLYHGRDPVGQLDHINGQTGDNRIANLRESNPLDNMRNQKKNRRNKSGVTGVSWDRETGRWCTGLKVKGRHINLGRYEDWFDAVCARMSANNRYGYHENHGRR